MKKLESKSAAFSIASATVAQNLSALDAAVSAKGNELKLTDAEYNAFRNDAINYRAGLLPAYQADQQAAKLNAPKAPAAAPVSAVVPPAPKA